MLGDSFGWLNLPKSHARCWFAVMPGDIEELKNYIMIMDDFAVALHEAGHNVPYLMMWYVMQLLYIIVHNL